MKNNKKNMKSKVLLQKELFFLNIIIMMSSVPSEKDNLSTDHKSLVNYCRIVKNEMKELLTFRPKEWMNAFRPNPKYPLFVRGDIDGFIALFINTISTLLAVILSLQPILGEEIVYGKIVPG
jgi:hypothetical protein